MHNPCIIQTSCAFTPPVFTILPCIPPHTPYFFIHFYASYYTLYTFPPSPIFSPSLLIFSPIHPKSPLPSPIPFPTPLIPRFANFPHYLFCELHYTPTFSIMLYTFYAYYLHHTHIFVSILSATHPFHRSTSHIYRHLVHIISSHPPGIIYPSSISPLVQYASPS